MIDFIKTFISDICSSILGFICSILPDSPFTKFIDSIQNIPYVNVINYFIPIDVFLTIAEAWLTCIITWYVFQLIYKVLAEVADAPIK